MFDYAVVEISGKQYFIKPGSEILVDYLGTESKISCEKVLLLKTGDKVEVGTPFLKLQLDFEVLGSEKQKKIRVSTYHAKANTRRTIGSRAVKSKVKLADKAVKN